MNKQKTKKFIKQATASLAKAGYTKPAKTNPKYQAQIFRAVESLGQLELLAGAVDDMDRQADVYHTATFFNRVAATVFQFLLDSLDYVVERHRAFVDKHEIRFRQATCLSAEEMIGQTARLSDVAHDLGGRYDGWDVDFYKDTRSFVPVSDPANRPVTGINWHSFERTYAPYPQSLSILYEPQKAYQYMQDAGSDRFFSVLHADDVSQLMSKLRKQEGCLDVFRFQHFDDRYVTELTEILQKNYYSTVKFCGDFTDLAYAADRLGNRQVAITLAFHAMSTGEDFETMADQLDEMNETDLGVACKRKADFDALNEQVKPVPNRCDATKHKI
ncbi:hypothetical protein CTYAZ2_26350 [Comamonas testosteroni]|nr:hypothetical protein CTYAZ2_26350 [Comamonas testosteroni]